MLIEWTKLNKKLKKLQESREKISTRLEFDDDKVILLRPERDKFQKELDKLIIKLKTPAQKEIKILERKKTKLIKKYTHVKKSNVLECWDQLNNKLEKIEENKKELLKKSGLTKEWDYIEKKRVEKQKEFNKKYNELRIPIKREISELQIKKNRIISGKEEGSAIECDFKLRELQKRYDEDWVNVLRPINDEQYKLITMQRILLRKKGLLEKWDKLEKKGKEIEEKREEIEERREEIEERREEIEERREEIEEKISQLRKKGKNILQKNKRVKKLEQKISKIRDELDKIYEKRKKLIDPIDLEIVKIKQKLKRIEKSPEVKRWIKSNKKLPYADLINKKHIINNLGVYDLKSLINLFESWKNNFPKQLYYCSWHLTGMCNSNCIMCEQRNVKDFRNTEFDAKLVNKVLIQLKNMGLYHLSFSGGEPTLVKNLILIIKKAKTLGFKTQIFTNAINLNEKNIIDAYESGLDSFFISLDSPNKGIHNSIRRIKSWSKTVDSISFIKQNTNCEVIINTVVQKKNYKNLDEMVDLAKKINADNISFSHVDSFIKNNQKVRLNKKQMKEFYFKIVPKILKKSISAGVNVQIIPMLSPLVNKSEKFVINQLTKNTKKFEEEINNFSNGNYGKDFYNEYNCYNPFRTIQIMPNGNVHPCCPTMYLDDFIMGNVKKQNLIEIFNSNKFKEFRKNVKEKKLDVCKTCRYNQKENYQLSKVLN